VTTLQDRLLDWVETVREHESTIITVVVILLAWLLLRRLFLYLLSLYVRRRKPRPPRSRRADASIRPRNVREVEATPPQPPPVSRPAKMKAPPPPVSSVETPADVSEESGYVWR